MERTNELALFTNANAGRLYIRTYADTIAEALKELEKTVGFDISSLDVWCYSLRDNTGETIEEEEYK